MDTAPGGHRSQVASTVHGSKEVALRIIQWTLDAAGVPPQHWGCEALLWGSVGCKTGSTYGGLTQRPWWIICILVGRCLTASGFVSNWPLGFGFFSNKPMPPLVWKIPSWKTMVFGYCWSYVIAEAKDKSSCQYNIQWFYQYLTGHSSDRALFPLCLCTAIISLFVPLLMSRH